MAKDRKDRLVIKTSKASLWFSITASGLFLLSACILATLLFDQIRSDLQVGKVLILTMWSVIGLFWLIGSFIAWVKWHKAVYTFTADSLIVTKGGFFHTASDMYRYESIIKVHVKQDLFGKYFGYASIIFSIPRMDKAIEIKGVINPEAQAEELKSRIISLNPARMLD